MSISAVMATCIAKVLHQKCVAVILSGDDQTHRWFLPVHNQ